MYLFIRQTDIVKNVNMLQVNFPKTRATDHMHTRTHSPPGPSLSQLYGEIHISCLQSCQRAYITDHLSH